MLDRSVINIDYCGALNFVFPGRTKLVFEAPNKNCSRQHFLARSPEHAQGELLGSCDVRRKCGRLRRPSVNLLLVYTLEGTVLIRST